MVHCISTSQWQPLQEKQKTSKGQIDTLDTLREGPAETPSVVEDATSNAPQAPNCTPENRTTQLLWRNSTPRGSSWHANCMPCGNTVCHRGIKIQCTSTPHRPPQEQEQETSTGQHSHPTRGGACGMLRESPAQTPSAAEGATSKATLLPQLLRDNLTQWWGS